MDTLGETLQANGLRVGGAYRRHDRLWGGEEPDDARLLQAAESLGERRVLVSAGEHSLSITPKEINGTGYQIFVYGSRGEDMAFGMKLVIVDNSAKYKTEETGHLRISSEDTGRDCRLTLTDDSPGVPGDALPKLFDAFYRSDPARKNPSGGSGLGLAIASRTVERMGGTIAARNAPEAGLEITITLPEEDDHAKDSDR